MSSELICLTAAIDEANSAPHLAIPQLNTDGRHFTLNRMGGNFASSVKNVEVADYFLPTALRPGSKVLELGAAYGLVCSEAIRRGLPAICHYVVNDLDKRHLLIFARRLAEEFPLQVAELEGRLSLLHGEFPSSRVVELLMQSGEGQFDAVLSTHFLGWLKPDALVKAFEVVGRLLKPGGVLCIRGSTPYMGYVRQEVRDAIDRQSAEYAQSPCIKMPTAGFIPDFRQALPDRDDIDVEAVMHEIPTGHYFTITAPLVKKLAEDNGMRIERSEYVSDRFNEDAPDLWNGWALDGRERLVVIARKTDSLARH